MLWLKIVGLSRSIRHTVNKLAERKAGNFGGQHILSLKGGTVKITVKPGSLRPLGASPSLDTVVGVPEH